MFTVKDLNKSSITGLVFLGVAALIFMLQLSGFFQPIEKNLLDQKFRSFEREVENPRVTLLMIDQKSLDAFIQNHGIYWPWPREVYSTVHNYLTAKQAKLVAYDILMDQPDFNRNGFSGRQSDQSLEQILGTYQNGVLAAQTAKTDTGRFQPDFANFTYTFSLPGDQPYYSISNRPIPGFRNTARAIGSVAIPTDNESVIRSVPLFFNLDDEQALPSLGMAAYLSSKNPGFNITTDEGLIHIDSMRVPLQPNGKYLINWYKKGGVTDGTFENISFYSLFEAALQFRATGNARNDAYINLKDNVVFVGANAAGLSDIKSTPLSPLEAYPGVEIHATVTQNMLDEDFITFVPDLAKYIFQFSLIAIILWVIFGAPSNINIPFSVLVPAGVLLVGLILFAQFRVWFPTAEIFVTSILTIIAGYTTKYVSEDAQKRALRNAFGLYLQKELVEQIVDEPKLLKLGGDKKELTVLFSDLAGFTSISENTEPQELVTFLNEYLSEMTKIVFNNKGTLDKFIGDAIMAFWGAPVSEDDHAYYACKCVIEMEEKMAELQQKWSSNGMPSPHVRYGLNTGEMVVGNMGSDDRFSYTVLGDNVNLGARLEPANKDFGTQILISESTQERIKDRFLTREVALLTAKGKSKPIKIFELIGTKDLLSENNLAVFLDAYKQGLAAYYNRCWDETESHFTAALHCKPDDTLSKMYLENIQKFKVNPPDANWDGSYQQINK